MTTRTGTTRKAPWAVFLTALLAALAMVLGSLVIAAPAQAKNDKEPPGQSEQGPPGHQGDTTLPPGQQDDGTPGNSGGSTGGTDTPGMSHDKIQICHATAAVNNPYTMPKVDMASVDEWGNADLNGHGLHGGVPFATTMVQGDHWGDIIPPFTYTYTVKEGKGQDKVEVTKTVVFGGLNWTEAGKAIYNNGCQPTTPPPPPPTPEKCPPGSLNPDTVLDGPYNEAEDYAKCYVNPPPPVVPEITPEQASVIDAAVAAMPQPATVAVPAPAKVPSKGPILPAAVPAGDGSTAPVLPVTALALLVLASTALAASTVRLLGAKR